MTALMLDDDAARWLATGDVATLSLAATGALLATGEATSLAEDAAVLLATGESQRGRSPRPPRCCWPLAASQEADWSCPRPIIN